MSNNISQINDEVASTLIANAVKKKMSGGKKQKYDVVVEKIPSSDGTIAGKYAAYTFYVVKKGKAQSAPRALGELVLRDVVSKILDFSKGELSSVYSVAGDLSGGLDSASGGWLDTKEIYGKASSVGGKMQLHAAKKMGHKTFNMAQVFGLSAHVYYGGIARFEEVEYGSKGLDIVICYWMGLGNSVGFIDRFRGSVSGYDYVKEISRLDKWGGDFKARYMYSPVTGLMW